MTSAFLKKMGNNIYLLKSRKNKNKKAYTYVNNTPFNIYFINKENSLDLIIGVDKEAEKAINGKESEYDILRKHSIKKESEIFKKLIKKEEIYQELNKSHKLMVENEYDGLNKIIFSDKKSTKLVPLEANNLYDGQKQNFFYNSNKKNF